MKFTCLKDNLAQSLSIVSKAVPLRHSLPILTNVLIVAKDGRLLLAGTNLDTVITTYVGASIDEEGSITVPAKLLSEFISHLSSESVVFTLKNDILHLKAGKNKSKFNGASASDFPDLPQITEKLSHLELPPREFCNAISQVGFAVAVDDTRPVFSGILLNYSSGKLVIVGSDGFRLSEKILDVKSKMDDFSVVLPAKTLLEVARIFGSCEENIKVYLNDNENLCLFECEDTLVVSRIIDGSYPDYKRIIPVDTKVTTSFLANELLEAVKLTNVFAKDANNTLKMSVDPSGRIKVSSSSQETGGNNSEIPAEIIGTLDSPFEIVFNSRYLLEFLTNNKFEKLVFHASESITPCLIKPDEDGTFLHVMAPMHVND